MRSWDLVHMARPPADDREWRDAFRWLARKARVPHLGQITVAVAQTCAAGPLPDWEASADAAFAAIAGLVDADVIADVDHLVAVTMLAPQLGDEDRFIVALEQCFGEVAGHA